MFTILIIIMTITINTVEDLAVADSPETAGDVTIIIIEGGEGTRCGAEGDRQLNSKDDVQFWS